MTNRRSIVHYSLPFVLMAAGTLEAQQCSSNTTVGKYVVVCDGYLSPAPNAPMVPAKILGTATGESDGIFTGSATASVGGTIVIQSVKGTAQTNADCTGKITYTQTLNGQPGPPLNIAAVVSSGGDTIHGLVVDSGTILSCTLTRMSRFQVASLLPADSPARLITSRLDRR